MNNRQESIKRLAEVTLPWLVLAIILTYSYAKFFQHPYGFSWAPNGSVDRIFVDQEGPTLMLGDQLVQVGPLTWDAFQADLRRTFFKDVKPGEITPIVAQRNGQTVTIQWRLPGLNEGEIRDQLFSEWPLIYVFWVLGVLTLLFLRPKDDRWWLLAAFNFLTAIWLSAGSGLSNFHIWNAALVLRMAIWLSVPTYLHLHWVFPRPLGKLPPILVWVLYGVFLVLAIAQGLQLVHSSLYFLGFLTAILGSVVLLILHAFRQPGSRRDLRLIFIALALALAPLLAISLVNIWFGSSRFNSLLLLSFPALPLAYLYAAYRHQLGGLEMRVNRLISIYSFLILLCTLGIPILAAFNRRLSSLDGALMLGVFSAGAATAASIWGLPLFQKFVERRWLGISLPNKSLSEIYSGRLATSHSFAAFDHLLKDEILPTLLIRQFVFLRVDKNQPQAVISVGVTPPQIPEGRYIPAILAAQSRYLPAGLASAQPYSWVRLALPLKVEDQLVGLWLFGRRDPDDYYSQAEVSLIESLANQTAIATSNILRAEQLRVLYQTDIHRHEEQRQRLALELHDSVLNEMAAMLMGVDLSTLPPNFQKAYNEVIQRLREIVSNLRPPMLNYGLRAGIQELADNLMERNKDKVTVEMDIQGGEQRYSTEIEQHLFRIVQEACENALRHGQPHKVLISGQLLPRQIELKIEDDGVGFEAGVELELDGLLSRKHFGLAGIVQRAALIDAEARIHSTQATGTQVSIKWDEAAPQVL
jgi:signal transduction histidine kinase